MAKREAKARITAGFMMIWSRFGLLVKWAEVMVMMVWDFKVEKKAYILVFFELHNAISVK